MKSRIVIIYDDPGLGPDGSIRDDVVDILEKMLPYMLDNIEVISGEDQNELFTEEEDRAHGMMIAGDTVD